MKKWLLFSAFTLLTFGLVACSDKSNESADKDSGENVELNFWIFGSPGYDVMVDEYMDKNPNVKIKINGGEMEDVMDNLFTSVSAGSGAPDVAMIDIGQIPKFLQAQDQFYNLNDYGAEDIADRYLDWKWQQGQSADGSYQLGVPTDIGPTAMFYRTDVMEEAGFPTDPDELALRISTWDEYYEAAKEIKEKTGKPITDSNVLLFNAIRDQQDQQYFNEDDELIVEESLKGAYDFATKMSQEGLIGKSKMWTPEWGGAMADGSYATMPGAPAWMIANVKGNAPDAGGKWSLTAIPEGGGNWGGSILVVPKESDLPQEAFDFIEWLTSEESQLKSFTNNGLFPSTPGVFENEDFLATTDEYFGGAPTAKIFAEAAKTVKPIYMGENYQIAASEIDVALTNVSIEGADPQTEWDEAIKRINTQLERQ